MIKNYSEFINESEKNYISIREYDWGSLFKKINSECFDSKLKLIPITVKELTNASGKYIAKWENDTLKVIESKIIISLSFHMTEESAKNLLCHEMIHHYVATVLKDPKNQHGDKFKREMNRINKIPGYKITLTDDIPKEVNYLEIGEMKKKIGILMANTNVDKKVVYIMLPDVNNIDWEKVTKLVNQYKLKNHRIFFTKNPIIKKFSVPKEYKVLHLRPQYYYLYKEIANHPSTEDKTQFFETFFE